MSKASAAWSLWTTLGTVLSDLGRWREAEEAYDGALANGAPGASVAYNRAIVRRRQYHQDEALAALEAAPPNEREEPELWTMWQLLRLDLLLDLNRIDEAELAAATLPERFDEDSDLAELYAVRADIAWRRNDPEAALREAWKGVGYNHRKARLQRLIRVIENRRSPQARSFRLSLRGSSPAKGAKGCFVIYDVIAESVEAAMELARRFEPENIRESLEIHQATPGEPCADEAMGVLCISGYILF